MLRLLLALLIAAALAVLYFFIALNWSYSSGERAGWVQKLSKKGWICKTWEGELALVSLPGSAVEKFYFTVHDDETAAKITRLVGRRVSLHYEEKVGLPTNCFGETRHFVTGVMEAPDIPLGPGVSLPQQPVPGVSAAPGAVPGAPVPPAAAVAPAAPVAPAAAVPPAAPIAPAAPAAPAAPLSPAAPAALPAAPAASR
ncbi:MAG: hypothetical protein JNJ71_09070 [Rubrivivax sp.]|nr:hypothetical protein [Rubrivivax sp.]